MQLIATAKTIMKALQDFSTLEKLAPSPTGNEVLVRVHSFGVTHNDVQLRGLVPADKLGTTFSGTIEEFSGETNECSIGQRVFGLAIRGGAFAEYVVCPIETICPMPQGMSFSSAAGLADSWFSAFQLLKHDVEIKKRDQLLIYNAMSTVGQTTVELAQILGCRRIFAVVNSELARRNVEAYLKMRTALYDEVLAVRESPQLEKEVKKFGDGGNYGPLAAIVDLRQHPSSSSVQLLANDGRLALTSVMPDFAKEDMISVVYRRLRLQGVTFRAREPGFYKAARDWIAKHIVPKYENLQLKPRVARVYDWKDTKSAFDFVKSSEEALGAVVCNVIPE